MGTYFDGCDITETQNTTKSLVIKIAMGTLIILAVGIIIFYLLLIVLIII